MLEHDDVVDILTAVAAADRRTVGHADVTMWLATLQHGGITSKDDALAAVVQHYATSTEWLMPAHLIRLVKAMRAERLKQLPDEAELMAGVDANGDPTEWLRIKRERIAAIADGLPTGEIRMIGGTR